MTHRAIKYKCQIMRHFNRAAENYNRFAHLQNRIGHTLLATSDCDMSVPKIVDLGSGTGSMISEIHRQFLPQEIWMVDIACNMLRVFQNRDDLKSVNRVCGDFDQLPFVPNAMDMVFCNMALQWTPHLLNALQEIKRILSPEGVLLCAMPVVGTLFELKKSAAVIGKSFITVSELKQCLADASMTLSAFHEEQYTLHYPSVAKLLHELKMLGVRYSLGVQANRGCRGRNFLYQLEKNYQDFVTCHGTFPVTYKIAYFRAC